MKASDQILSMIYGELMDRKILWYGLMETWEIADDGTENLQAVGECPHLNNLLSTDLRALG